MTNSEAGDPSECSALLGVISCFYDAQSQANVRIVEVLTFFFFFCKIVVSLSPALLQKI